MGTIKTGPYEDENNKFIARDQFRHIRYDCFRGEDDRWYLKRNEEVIGDPSGDISGIANQVKKIYGMSIASGGHWSEWSWNTELLNEIKQV
jgi:hypothetical protein